MDDTSENFDFHTNIHICHNELCREHLKYIALLLLSQADTLNSVIRRCASRNRQYAFWRSVL